MYYAMKRYLMSAVVLLFLALASSVSAKRIEEHSNPIQGVVDTIALSMITDEPCGYSFAINRPCQGNVIISSDYEKNPTGLPALRYIGEDSSFFKTKQQMLDTEQDQSSQGREDGQLLPQDQEIPILVIQGSALAEHPQQTEKSLRRRDGRS